jgi:hypothetical protein
MFPPFAAGRSRALATLAVAAHAARVMPSNVSMGVRLAASLPAAALGATPALAQLG